MTGRSGGQSLDRPDAGPSPERPGAVREVDAFRVVPVAELPAAGRAAWLALRADDPRYANPFLHPAFAECVARSREGVEVAVLESGGEAAGFFAFQRRDGGRAAEPVGGVMADVQAAVTVRGLAWDVEAMLEACAVDVLEYDHLLADSPAFEGWHESLDDAPTMNLADGFDAYRETVESAGSSVFKQIDRKARKLAREVGPVRLDLRAGDPRLLDTLIEWKRRRVRAQGFDDPLGDEPIRRLVEAVHRAAEPGFEGILSVLWAGDRPVAAHLGVLGDAVLASWVPAFDPDPALRGHSAGSILHAELARAAADEGVARMDLGRGENRLKTRLSTGAVPLAIGAVDRRPVRRAIRAGRARLKAALLASPIGEPLRRGVRRLRAGRRAGGAG